MGAGEPIAYALDGYPIYGYQDEKSPEYAPLDALCGHQGADGRCHYHATMAYPYPNRGFHGEVVERGGQVDPQPRAQGPRPAQPPLRGARITGFRRDMEHGEFAVEYEYRGERRAVRYALQGTRAVTFVYDDGTDGSREERFTLSQDPEGRPLRGSGEGQLRKWASRGD